MLLVQKDFYAVSSCCYAYMPTILNSVHVYVKCQEVWVLQNFLAGYAIACERHCTIYCLRFQLYMLWSIQYEC